MEFVGIVTPSSYTGQLQLHRTKLSSATYTQSSVLEQQSNAPIDDTDPTAHRDDDPQSGGSAGKIYDWDTPGRQGGTLANSPYRLRANFSEFATLSDGVTVISGPLNYFVRISCKFSSTGSPTLATSVTNDNRVGSGTTVLTWNLQ